MTKKKRNNSLENSTSNYHKLSIQISLNGLSFCVVDTISNMLVVSETVVFETTHSPYEVQKHIEELFKQYNVKKATFSEVVVIHNNNLFNLVPKALFNKEELPNYLKYNAKILANDFIVYDEIDSHDIVNVYVPFVNINNYIYDIFGEFEFKHSGTIMVESLLKSHNSGNETVCYVHIAEQQLNITIIAEKKLLLYNCFNYNTKEDFIYYLLFTLEQLKLDTEKVKVNFFGTIKEEDAIYKLCYEYIKNTSIFVPENTSHHLKDTEEDSIDFTLLNTL